MRVNNAEDEGQGKVRTGARPGTSKAEGNASVRRGTSFFFDQMAAILTK